MIASRGPITSPGRIEAPESRELFPSVGDDEAVLRRLDHRARFWRRFSRPHPDSLIWWRAATARAAIADGYD
jgi:hypothetical protein